MGEPYLAGSGSRIPASPCVGSIGGGSLRNGDRDGRRMGHVSGDGDTDRDGDGVRMGIQMGMG